MPNKIEGQLSHEQLAAFMDELRGMSAKPTLAAIQAAAKRHGVEVSLMGAKTFRDNTFQAHLARLAAGREKSAQILQVIRDGGAHPLDAVEEAAAADLLDAYTNGADVDVGQMVKTALQLRASIEQRKDRERNDRNLERQLADSESKRQMNEKNLAIAEERARKLEREREDWERKQRSIAEQLERARTAKGIDADEVRAAAVAAIDEIMGIKPKAA